MARPLLSFDADPPYYQNTLPRDLVNNSLQRDLVNNPFQRDMVNNSLQRDLINNSLQRDFVNNSLQRDMVNNALQRDMAKNALPRDMPTPPWSRNQNLPGRNSFPVPPRTPVGLSNGPPNYNVRRQEPSGGMESGRNQSPPWHSQSKPDPPSLFSSMIHPPARVKDQHDLNRYNSPNVSRSQDIQRSAKQSPSPRRQTTPNKPKPASEDLEQKALQSDVSVSFYERIKPLSMMQIAENVALEFARKEFFSQKGEQMPSDKPSGIGHHACVLCKLKFLSKDKLNSHCNMDSHKQLENLYKLKKEQARLIMQNKMPHPSERPDSQMVAIVRAEVEMDLKPAELDLDSYILGIYESIMKPYWPVPKSSHYCRICNYMEFKSEADSEHHKTSREHKRREESYQEAFCLYCQVHNQDVKKMAEHEKTKNHLEVKELMEKTKQRAIEHWHKVNRMDLPAKYQVEEQPQQKQPVVSKNDDSPKVGNKRGAPEPAKDLTSPVKKVSTGNKSISSAKTESKGTKSETSAVKQVESKPQSRGKLSSNEKKVPKKASDNDSKKLSTRTEKPMTEKEKMWFTPMSGLMCMACHVFIANESEQKLHAGEPSHATNIAKFKKTLLS